MIKNLIFLKDRSLFYNRLGRALISGFSIIALISVQFVTVFLLGIGIESDLYYSVIVFPQFISLVLTVLIQNTCVPFLKESKDIKSAEQIIFYFSVCLGIILTICMLSGVYILQIAIESFELGGEGDFIFLLYISSFLIILNAINSGLQAIFYARDKFSPIEITSFFSSSVALIALIIIGKNLSVVIAIYILIIRTIIYAIPLLSPSLLLFRFTWQDFKKILIRIGFRYPAIVGFTKSDPIIDRLLLSGAGDGLMTLHALAYQLVMVSSSLIAKVFGNESLSRFSDTNYSEDFKNRYFREVSLSVFVLASMVVIVFVILYFTALPWLSYILDFKVSNFQTIFYLMLLLSGLFFGGLLRQIVENIYHANSNTSLFVKITSINFIIYLAVKVIGFSIMGLYWLCISCSLYVILDLIILKINAKKYKKKS